MDKIIIDPKDKRWDGHIPWFFRHGDFNGTGNFLLFFERISQRLYRLFYHNELGIQNLNHFGSYLESKSLQRYRFVWDYHFGESSLANSINTYFSPKNIKGEMEGALTHDPEYKKAHERTISGARMAEVQQTHLHRVFEFERDRQPQLEPKYYQPLFVQRLGVLEVLLQILPKNELWFGDLVMDIRRYFAEAGIMLDANPKTYQIELLEETLLQKEIIDNLLPRLSSAYPDRAKELTKAYHDMIAGEPFDEIFISAYKTLEELGRSITGNKSFHFTESDLAKHFPNLHGQIHSTIIKLKSQRDDKGAHGKTAPKPYEMRYLLFSIMNIALLLLDYQS